MEQAEAEKDRKLKHIKAREIALLRENWGLQGVAST
jgi:hypothetical protein